MSIRDDVQVDWEKDPRIIKVLAPSVEMAMQDLFDTARSIEHTPDPDWDVFSYPSLLNSAGKEDLGGGVLVGITLSLLNAQIAFEARTTSVSSGVITTGDPNGITLHDSAADFIADGVEPGAVIINFTDGSVASVIKVENQYEILHEPLNDGVSDDWQIGDAYKIWNWTLCELAGGNAVSTDELDAQIDVLLPRFGVSYVRTSSSSATLLGTDAIYAAITSILGLVGENTKWSSISHNAAHLLTAARITEYDDNTLVTPVNSWDIEATYDADGELLTYQMVKV